MSTAESAFWTLLFLVLGTGLIAARNGAEGAWPIMAAAVAYCAAAYFLWRLLISDR